MFLVASLFTSSAPFFAQLVTRETRVPSAAALVVWQSSRHGPVTLGHLASSNCPTFRANAPSTAPISDFAAAGGLLSLAAATSSVGHNWRADNFENHSIFCLQYNDLRVAHENG
jgi:hypothetical protein